MRSAKIGNGIAALLFFASLPAAAAQQSWRAIGQVGGPTQGVAVQGHYAYVGVGLRLVTLDISNPADMREVGVTPPFPHFVEDVAVSGTLAYVAAGGSGLRVVDISNPVLPTEVGAWDSRGYANGIAVAGSIAYLADGPYGLRVVDVSKPSQPVEVGSAYPVNYAFKVAVQGRVACIAAAGAGILIADVTDPRHPVEVGSLSTGGYAYGVAVAGGSAYVADGWEGLKIVSVTDPDRPVLAGTYKTPGWAFGVVVADNKAYVADAFGGLRVIDVRDASRPVEVAQSAMPDGNAANVAVADGVAYVTDRFAGLRAVSFSGASSLSQIGSYRSLAYADAVAVAGKRAYVATNLGLAVVDVSEPSRPRQLGDLDLGGYATSVSVWGQWACIAMGGGGGAGLRIVDVSDPAHPTTASTYLKAPGMYRDMVVSDGIAYSVNEWGLEMVRVSDPLHPEWLGFLQMQTGGNVAADTVVGVAVSGTMAYTASASAGIEVVDVSDPRNPVWKGAYGTGSISAEDVAVSANRAYVASGGTDVFVVDISDPAHPAGMGSLATEGQAVGAAVAGGLAYVADGDKGLTAVDVSDPVRPFLSGTFDTVGFSHEVVPAEGRVYLADGVGGLLILEKGTASGTTGTAVTGPPAALGDRPCPPAAKRAPSGPAAVATGRHPGRIQSSSCVVTSAADSGSGTMRSCMANAARGTVITFEPTVFPGSSPTTIHLVSALPGLGSGNLTIDASNAGVIVDGRAIEGQPPGLLYIGSDGNVVRGLQVLGSPTHGFVIHGSGNVIGGDRTRGQGNIISAHGGNGIHINGSFSDGTGSNNTIVGNLIGTDASGTKPLGNRNDAIFLSGGASNNTIGGLEPGERNIISGNGFSGITVAGRTSSGNVFLGNYLGTDVTGTAALPNAGSGVSIEGGGSNNRIEGNLLSGNQGAGITIGDWNSCYNAVVGNRIGTDSTGTKAVANGSGVFLGFMGGSFNRIGGLRPEERNIISGNRQGITVRGPAAMGNLILGNYIGTDITGWRSLGNETVGVELTSDSRSMVGGATLREANVISATRAGAGVTVRSDDNYVIGNFIGTDSSGEIALGNHWWWAVEVLGAHNTIQTNVVANSEGGVLLKVGSGTPVRRNSIHSNTGKGISYTSVNVPIAAPVITTIDARTVSGRACPGCEVEMFSDSQDEGRLFEGSVVADAAGSFTLTLPRFLVGPNVTATATDLQGNTSEFSVPRAAPPPPPRRRAVRP
jgi:hypothetical protein